jgi:imidazolonepropionase
MAAFDSIPNAYVLIENGLIKAYGKAGAETILPEADEVIDAKGGMVLPSFIDSHTHIIFAQSREEEFVMRIQGSHMKKLPKQVEVF